MFCFLTGTCHVPPILRRAGEGFAVPPVAHRNRCSWFRRCLISLRLAPFDLGGDTSALPPDGGLNHHGALARQVTFRLSLPRKFRAV